MAGALSHQFEQQVPSPFMISPGARSSTTLAIHRLNGTPDPRRSVSSEPPYLSGPLRNSDPRRSERCTMRPCDFPLPNRLSGSAWVEPPQGHDLLTRYPAHRRAGLPDNRVPPAPTRPGKDGQAGTSHQSPARRRPPSEFWDLLRTKSGHRRPRHA
jgi:hypothetical protein